MLRWPEAKLSVIYLSWAPKGLKNRMTSQFEDHGKSGVHNKGAYDTLPPSGVLITSCHLSWQLHERSTVCAWDLNWLKVQMLWRHNILLSVTSQWKRLRCGKQMTFCAFALFQHVTSHSSIVSILTNVTLHCIPRPTLRIGLLIKRRHISFQVFTFVWWSDCDVTFFFKYQNVAAVTSHFSFK